MQQTAASTTDLLNVDWVKAHLREFHFEATDLTDPALESYRDFYKLKFEKEIPTLEISIGIREICGYRIAVHFYRQASTAKGMVFLLHGYYDHVGLFNHALKALLDTGYSVVTFDLPGHGLSSGERVAIPDFNRYQIVFRQIQAMFEQEAPQPWSVVAQSTGGAIVIDLVLDLSSRALPVPFKNAVLLAPLIRPRRFSVGRYIQQVVSPFTNYVKRGFAINSHNQDFLKFLRTSDPLQSHFLSTQWVGALKFWVADIESRIPTDYPLMVIQGQQDGTVEFEHNLKVRRDKFPRMELVLLPTARHQLVNESQELRQEIFAQMLRRVAR